MHGPGLHQSHVELTFGEEPERHFCTVHSACLAVEYQVHAVDAELFGEANDLVALGFDHPVSHDAESGDSQIVETDHVVGGSDRR